MIWILDVKNSTKPSHNISFIKLSNFIIPCYRKKIIFSFGICKEIRIIAAEFPKQFHHFFDPYSKSRFYPAIVIVSLMSFDIL
jgi:hypothetical protein